MSSGHLSTCNTLPDGLLECPAAQLWSVLPGPTLFDLSGGRKGTLFITVLQHGNETSGWDAMRTLLRAGSAPPLMLFIANIDAARQNVRKLENQVDFNRAWEGGDSPESRDRRRGDRARHGGGAARRHRHPQQHRPQSALQRRHPH